MVQEGIEFEDGIMLPPPPKGVRVFKVANTLREMYYENSLEKRQATYLDFIAKLGVTDENDDRITWFKSCLRQLEVSIDMKMVRHQTSMMIQANNDNAGNADDIEVSSDEEDAES